MGGARLPQREVDSFGVTGLAGSPDVDAVGGKPSSAHRRGAWQLNTSTPGTVEDLNSLTIVAGAPSAHGCGTSDAGVWRLSYSSIDAMDNKGECTGISSLN